VGYIKGRFPSFRGLRQQIDDSIAHERALAWIKACLVIHTLVGFIESGQEDEEFLDELVQEGLGDDPQEHVIEGRLDASSSRRQTRGEKKRMDLKRKLFASGIAVDRELE
jgi:hypothetical protein